MRVYISGPMTGCVDHNRPAFRVTAARLRALGYEVVSPDELNPEGCGRDWLGCMRVDIKHLVDCDAIAMLEGWHSSRGAWLEYVIALTLGHAVFRAVDIVERMAA
ncbi:DUF4406 domain-containing protein [Burkholderia vietnamiensis]|uniref:DUF4406 domain-containing protein n=1 Tax=Burkholderia vietnamiensis TaxID=60552 RepID=UPI0008418C95|nr:DUF4406 domain-containing protein [Burkholderia vietnamiensis]AOJ99908.1 hypothetical protein WK23_15425 [Burkholderia vietnamiensis]